MKVFEMLVGFFTWPPTPEQVMEWATFASFFMIGVVIGWICIDFLWQSYKKWRG